MNVPLLVWLLLCSVLVICGARQIPEKGHHKMAEKRTPESSVQNDEPEDSDDGEDGRSKEAESFEEYPIVTPKRAAMLLDRIMVALHHALEDSEDGQSRKINDVYRDGHYYGIKGSGKSHGGSKEKTLASKNKSGSVHKAILLTDEPEEEEEDLDERSVEAQQERDNTMDLQRRGQDLSAGVAANGAGAGKGRVYWRCYFNAVTCF